MRITLALLVLLGADGSPYLRRDLDGLKADYLVVAPPAFVDALDPLCAHRAKTYAVALVRTDDVARRHGKGPEGIARLVTDVQPKFLVLAGDADTVPPFVRKSAYTSKRFASDKDLATDHLFGAVAGRFPADTPEELASMIEKTIEYETALPAGRWCKRISFVTGQGGFGTIIDSVLEKHFDSIVTQHVPPEFDVELAYAKTSSPYCYYPPEFNGNVIRLLNEGSLFFTYVGHGLRTGFDDLPYKDRIYPILRVKDAAKIDARRGPPVMVALACDTGQFDSTHEDAIGEALFKQRGGPVAFIGGSRITQPYGNALLGRYLVMSVFKPDIETLGAAFWNAKRLVGEKDTSILRRQADFMAGSVQGPTSLELMRKDVVLHYNLFGDPALLVRKPASSLKLEVEGEAAAGSELVVRGTAQGGTVDVTFECARDAFYHSIDMKGDTVAERVARRYRNANNKVILSRKAEARNGSFKVSLPLPDSLEPGTYWLKASTPTSAAALELKLE